MDCTPLDIRTGNFSDAGNWLTASPKTFDDKKLTLNSNGLLVEGETGEHNIPLLPNHTLSYQVLGHKFLLVLDNEVGLDVSTRRVLVLNFETWQEEEVFTIPPAGNNTDLPVIKPSRTSGTVFLGYGTNLDEERAMLGIYRSDNGAKICPSNGTLTATGNPVAEATSTELIIRYTSVGGDRREERCARPLGECQITQPARTFIAYLGGCDFPPVTRQFTIRNTGDDCLVIESISDAAPFSVKSPGKGHFPLTLRQNETLKGTIEFRPTTIQEWNAQLHVETTPANGDDKIICHGEARNAEFKIEFDRGSPIDFEIVRVGDSRDIVLTVTNAGSKQLDVSVEVTGDSDFTCEDADETLDCGSEKPVTIRFAPSEKGQSTGVLSVKSDAPGNPHEFDLIGIGCIPEAQIDVPRALINFGQIEQGYRTVKLFKVKNKGNGRLDFKGEITNNPKLFGLLDPEGGSVIDTLSKRSYTAEPVMLCGGDADEEGSGEALIAVSFYADEEPNADGTPKLVTGTLTIGEHNAVNVPATQSFPILLSAKIVPPIPLDIALVVDRSGSMNEEFGERVKMAAAISASQLFVELLRADMDDRVAIVRFNELPDVVVPMVAVTTTDSPTKAEILQEVLSGIRPAEGQTAIAGGALTGIREVQKPRRSAPDNLKQVVIALSDGYENFPFYDPESEEWYTVEGITLNQPLGFPMPTKAMPRPAGIEIYALGLGTQINTRQMEALAGNNPDNFHHFNHDLTGEQYFAMEKYYTQIFMEKVDKSIISDPMYVIDPLDKHELEFEVLRGDVDVLIVVYDFKGQRLPFYCLSPQEELIDPVFVPEGFQLRTGSTIQARIVEFKMPAKEPARYAGRWRVIVEHPGQVCRGDIPYEPTRPGFLPLSCSQKMSPMPYGIAIGVGSNFRMTPFVTPAPVYTGDPILLTALMTEAGLPVLGCEVTVEVTLPGGSTSSPITLYDDGQHQDGDAGDGEYANSFTRTQQAGTYHFLFRATGTSRDGQPVQREAERAKAVYHRATEPPETGGLLPGLLMTHQEIIKAVNKQNRLLKRLLKAKKKK
jgi:hypothetical protein